MKPHLSVHHIPEAGFSRIVCLRIQENPPLWFHAQAQRHTDRPYTIGLMHGFDIVVFETKPEIPEKPELCCPDCGCILKYVYSVLPDAESPGQ